MMLDQQEIDEARRNVTEELLRTVPVVQATPLAPSETTDLFFSSAEALMAMVILRSSWASGSLVDGLPTLEPPSPPPFGDDGESGSSLFPVAPPLPNATTLSSS